MGSARYFVFERGKNWLVTLDGAAMARHETRPDAIKSAIVMADLMGTMNYDSDVMVDAEGRLEIAWTFGADPLPQTAEASR